MKDCNKRIPIIIPSLDPDERMMYLLKELSINGFENIIIVNDGSNESYDTIYKIAREKYKCKIIPHNVNMGKGRALKSAFKYCLDTFPDMVGCVTADSDGQHSVECIEQCMRALDKAQDSLILGVRDFSQDNVPWKSRFGNNLTKLVCTYLCDIKVSDTQTGLRGIPKSFMQHLLDVKGERFEFETQMLIEAKENLIEIKEVKITTIYDSTNNHVTHFNPITDSIQIYKIFGKIFMKYVLSSCSSFVVDIILFVVFEKMLFIFSPESILNVAIATVMARVFSAVYNYVINYKLVFNSKAKIHTSASKYATLAIVQMTCSAVFTTALSVLFPDVIAKIIIDTLLFFASYLIQQRYVFKRDNYGTV